MQNSVARGLCGKHNLKALKAYYHDVTLAFIKDNKLSTLKFIKLNRSMFDFVKYLWTNYNDNNVNNISKNFKPLYEAMKIYSTKYHFKIDGFKDTMILQKEFIGHNVFSNTMRSSNSMNEDDQTLVISYTDVIYETNQNTNSNSYRGKQKKNNGKNFITKKQLIEGLKKSLSIPVNSEKATKIMLSMGWDGGSLGTRGDGLIEPIKPEFELKPGAGLGHVKEPKVKRESKNDVKNQPHMDAKMQPNMNTRSQSDMDVKIQANMNVKNQPQMNIQNQTHMDVKNQSHMDFRNQLNVKVESQPHAYVQNQPYAHVQNEIKVKNPKKKRRSIPDQNYYDFTVELLKNFLDFLKSSESSRDVICTYQLNNKLSGFINNLITNVNMKRCVEMMDGERMILCRQIHEISCVKRIKTTFMKLDTMRIKFVKTSDVTRRVEKMNALNMQMTVTPNVRTVTQTLSSPYVNTTSSTHNIDHNLTRPIINILPCSSNIIQPLRRPVAITGFNTLNVTQSLPPPVANTASLTSHIIQPLRRPIVYTESNTQNVAQSIPPLIVNKVYNAKDNAQTSPPKIIDKGQIRTATASLLNHIEYKYVSPFSDLQISKQYLNYLTFRTATLIFILDFIKSQQECVEIKFEAILNTKKRSFVLEIVEITNKGHNKNGARTKVENYLIKEILATETTHLMIAAFGISNTSFILEKGPKIHESRLQKGKTSLNHRMVRHQNNITHTIKHIFENLEKVFPPITLPDNYLSTDKVDDQMSCEDDIDFDNNIGIIHNKKDINDNFKSNNNENNTLFNQNDTKYNINNKIIKQNNNSTTSTWNSVYSNFTCSGQNIVINLDSDSDNDNLVKTTSNDSNVSISNNMTANGNISNKSDRNYVSKAKFNATGTNFVQGGITDIDTRGNINIPKENVGNDINPYYPYGDSNASVCNNVTRAMSSALNARVANNVTKAIASCSYASINNVSIAPVDGTNASVHDQVTETIKHSDEKIGENKCDDLDSSIELSVCSSYDEDIDTDELLNEDLSSPKNVTPSPKVDDLDKNLMEVEEISCKNDNKIVLDENSIDIDLRERVIQMDLGQIDDDFYRKRTRSDSDTSNRNSTKKYKTKDTIIVHLTPNYSDIANMGFVKKIQTQISNKLDITKELPLLKCHGLKEGALVYSCYNEKSFLWLQNLCVVSDIRISKAEDLIVENINMSLKINCYIDQNYKDIFKRLENYNEGLSTRDWVWLKEEKFADYVIIVFKIDKDSFNYIEENNFRLFVGIDESQFSIVWN